MIHRTPEVKVRIEKYACDKCGKDLDYTNMMQGTCFEHVCFTCKNVQYLPKIYPRPIYLDDLGNEVDV